MKEYHLEDMKGGWLIGDFTPSCLRLRECEVACKYYRKGDMEPKHVHRIATEITVIASGHVRMNQKHYTTGDLVMVEPNEATDFEALEGTITVVVKVPSVSGDKYMI